MRQIVQRFNTAYRMSMIRNDELINGFIAGTMNGKRNGSMSVSDDGRRLFSYATCIAEWSAEQLLVNISKYSVTTSKQQAILGRCLGGVDYVEVDGGPMGLANLRCCIE